MPASLVRIVALRLPAGLLCALACLLGFRSLAVVMVRSTLLLPGWPCRLHEALRSIADEVLAVGFAEGLHDQVVVVRVAVLDQRTLHGLLMGIRGAEDRLHRPGVESCIEDAGRDCGRRGVEVAYLLGIVAKVAAELGKLHRHLHRGSRMAAHEVGKDILLLARLLAVALELPAEALIEVVRRLAHHIEDL